MLALGVVQSGCKSWMSLNCQNHLQLCCLSGILNTYSLMPHEAPGNAQADGQLVPHQHPCRSYGAMQAWQGGPPQAWDTSTSPAGPTSK